jgi:two-component system, LytTR family, sensor kinase
MTVRRLAPYRYIAVAWLAVAIVFAAHEYGAARADGRIVPIALVAYWSASEWLVWAGLTPLIFWLVARARVETGHYARPLGALALAGLACSFAQIVLQATLDEVATRLASDVASIRQWLSGYRAPGPAYLTYLVPRKIGFGYLVYWAVVAVGFMLRYHRLAVEQAAATASLERELANARLAAVRQQLHPHFLFNSLNGISELIHAQPDRAERMLAYLSDLLRRVIRSDTETRVTLGSELGFVRRYLALQRARYGTRLQVTLDVPRDVRRCLVPAQMLQPLVENAIVHGGPGAGRHGVIQIVGRVTRGRLQIAIRDHGPGVSESMTPGTGLTSSRARLEAAWEGDFALSLAGHSDGGAVCTIDTPCVM